MGAFYVHAESIESSRMRRGEIAVGAAAGRSIQQIETDLRGERPGVFVKRRARIALLLRGPIQSARYLHTDAFRPRFQIQDLGNDLIGVSYVVNSHIDLVI